MKAWRPDRIDTILYIYEEPDCDDEDELEVEANVTLEYDGEPYEAPSLYSPGGGGFYGSWLIAVHAVTMNGEELEGWELEAAKIAVERWASENQDSVDGACETALEEAAEDYEPDYDERYETPCPQYYDGTGRY